MRAAGYGDLSSGRQFIAVDFAGDGRAIEVLGDLTSAQRIAVIVPGSDTTLETFDRGPAAKARALYDALGRRAEVAVVAWLGYDPPEGLGLAAAKEDRARAGAVELKRFVTSLPAGAGVTLIGHSYGSVVVSLALPSLTARVTDAVFLASPGVPVAPASGLRSWSATAPNDWVNRIPHLRIFGLGHGAEARFTPLPADGVDGHDGYFKSPSTLDALAAIVLGPSR
jgi:pimeloyl-ACP methyl ester carboxylesterase